MTNSTNPGVNRTLWRQREAAEYFGISERTLFKWRKMGLPWHEVVGCVFIDMPGAIKWVKEFDGAEGGVA